MGMVIETIPVSFMLKELEVLSKFLCCIFVYVGASGSRIVCTRDYSSLVFRTCYCTIVQINVKTKLRDRKYMSKLIFSSSVLVCFRLAGPP